MIPIIKNFQEVIEHEDIGRMNKELYEFLHLHCGFIAHYDINGFKATYKNPRDFAEVFIRHFVREHRYYSGIYRCHEEPCKETRLTKAQIKREFERIIDRHKDEISRWAKEEQRQERYALYLKLKEEFEGGEPHDRRL
jgi:arginyl-tRNA--protein-N-Asp/Glu arginylyltransferase